jgi:Cysteine dioxygenase type I
MTLLEAPETRTLTPEELQQVAHDLATDDSTWRHLVSHTPDQRNYFELHRDGTYDAWLICWMNDHDTGFHDHDTSNGCVAVVEGDIVEERMRMGSGPLVRRFRGGTSFGFDHSSVHRMHHDGGEPAVTIHVYSPPLWRMGAYAVSEDGTLRREALSYAEELRPLG